MGIGWIMAAGLLMAQDPPRDLADLSLEELMRIEVTTASRKEQSLFDAPAAAGVIRGEDIRRMGVRSIPEALRMVPGTNVSRIDANKWAVSIRGFSDRFSNKLQVLIDGRSVYTPLFSGVFWDQQDVFLEDVDRIEVIRGPGGAVWGANAVNGVINVITKKAKDTHGGLLFAGGGTEERGFGGLRWGGAAGADVHYRAYAKYYVRDEQRDPVTEDPADDDSWQGRAGFRTEWAASDVDTLTVSGEYFAGKSGTITRLAAPAPQFVDPADEDYDLNGGHAILRWERRLGGTGLLSAQLSLARTLIETSYFGETRNTLDFDVTHRWMPVEGHDVVWGAGYRLTRDDVSDSFSVQLDPERETDDVVSVFAQDEIALSGEALKLTLGARAEHNDYTGFEVQPSARLAFRPHDRHMLWLAASRAVRTPSRGENDIRLIAAVLPPPAVPPGLTDSQVRVYGSRHVDSEDLLAYEAGYRVRPDDALTLDVAFFYNDYDNLVSNEPRGTSVEGTTLVIASEFDNDYEGRTYGAELAATWQVANGVRVYGAYTALKMNLDHHGDSADAGAENAERRDAKGQAFARVSLDVVEDVAVDLMGRYVGPLGARDVDAYSELDLRVAWRALPSLELSVVGQNLLRDEHLESSNTGLTERATEVERGVYLMGVWTF
jgi:iron complex outermembrane receptor protein